MAPIREFITILPDPSPFFTLVHKLRCSHGTGSRHEATLNTTGGVEMSRLSRAAGFREIQPGPQIRLLTNIPQPRSPAP